MYVLVYIIFYENIAQVFINTMKSTKVQTLRRIWRMVYWNIWIENTLHAYVLGEEHTSIKNELYIVQERKNILK